MDWPSLLIGAVANGIVDQIIHDLSNRSQFIPIRKWLSGTHARLPFEEALAHAVQALTLADMSGGEPILDWRCLLPLQIADALSKAGGPWGNSELAQDMLVSLWAGMYPASTRAGRKLRHLAALFVKEFGSQLSQDPWFGLVLQARRGGPVTGHDENRALASESIQDSYRYQVSVALRRIPSFWHDLMPPESSEEVIADLPFVLRMDLREMARQTGLPVAIYPGEKAILLVGGQSVSSPVGPGALDPKQITRQYPHMDRSLEAVIYGTDDLM